MADESSPPPSPDADDLVGTVLAGRYRIVRKLGGGAMGSVYLGEHLRFGRMDAIKVLRPGMARDKESTDRFLRGARNASAINHPNVCTVYDFGDTDEGLQFLAMEYVDGVCLSDVLEDEGPLPLRRGLDIARQIGEALDAAHHLGIVHRDLKPGNVMLVRGRDGRDVVKVVDFDIAKGSADGEGSEVTRTGFVVGTPEYMSPEQLIGDPLDGRSDVYSLALVFVRIITGRLPARSTSTQDLMVERLTQDPLRISEIAPALLVPEGVQAAVDHALERRREDRPASSAAFVAELLRGARSDAEPPPPTPAASGGRTPSRPPPAAGRDVPATQVGAAPAAGAGVAAQPSRSLKGLVPILVGGVVVMAAGVGLLQMLGNDAGDEAPAGVDTAAAPPGDLDSPTSTSTPPASDSATSPIRSADTGPEDSVASDPVGRDEAPVTTRTPVEEPPAPPPAPRGLSTLDARALLDRQMDRLTESPDPATLAIVTDSARVVWDQTSLPDSIRALAAYIRGDGLHQAGRDAEAETWLERAVQLAPEVEGYRMLWRLVGGGS